MSAINFFATAQVYGASWQVKEERRFSTEEINAVDSAEITSADYGLSVCFMMKGGGSTYISLSKESDGSVGQKVDVKDLKLLTLERQGETCNKVILAPEQ